MMEVLNEGGLVKLWSEGVHIEDEARDQLKRVARLPFVFRHVAAMPDSHWGMGATVGSVICSEHAIIPAAVGVDIGCGIAGWRTEMRRQDIRDGELVALRHAIERAIPHGRTDNGGPNDRGAWSEPPEAVREVWDEISYDLEGVSLTPEKVISRQRAKGGLHLGTLGTGNHFIEIAADQNDALWILLHSGSRGPGAAFANHWIAEAKRVMARYWIELEDGNLAYLPRDTPELEAYLAGVFWAQGYARANRHLMLERVRGLLGALFGDGGPIGIEEQVETPHNFIARERHFGRDVMVTRKGACRARQGDRVVIPGAMGRRSYIVTGKGEREAFMSCSHGAGRAMSRTAARKAFSLEDHARATQGLECRKDADVLDETPGAYKDIDAVIRAQADLVEPTHVLSALVNVKG